MTADQSVSVAFVEIPNAEGYDAGSDGHVYSRRTRGHVGLRSKRIQLKEKTDRYGYREVTIYSGRGRRSSKVHTLILTAFAGLCPPDLECRHLDGNPANNFPDNLAWGTSVENKADMRRHGTVHRGAIHYAAKLTEDNVREIRKLKAEGWKTRRIAERFSVTPPNVNFILAAKTWAHVR